MELKNFDQLVSTVKGMSEKRVVAVAAAADQHVIESVLEAKQEGHCPADLGGRCRRD